ncbi:toxin-antitoxin system YwqK family antitoxin [Candidatus Palauibacter sp.]|uniref:toxin-antitoxin system YwqK family antitoxin n=1 Tax=Candidatus Palauibacter sp. TaxID=3101350 RepID=UPI003B5947A1
MNRAQITTVALFSLMAGPAHAQRLVEVEGIELRGSARVLQYGAGTCNVLEHVETATEYERKKANHGQPVDVWQLDLSVYNGSGKPLDHLIARYGIAAESPPCTNWTSPEAGQIPGHTEWGNWYGTIQRSGGGDLTVPGETVSRTVYLLVFREHQPRFDTWSVDYNFAAAAPAAGAENPVSAGGAAARSHPGNERIEQPDSPVGGALGAATPPSVGAGETCAGQPVGSECWMEVANQPGCHLWNGGLAAGATVTWSGECSAGYAQGTGRVHWRYDDGEQLWAGAYVDGKRQGNWVVLEDDGDLAGGSYVSGQRQGIWTWWFTNGDVLESPFVNGEENGTEIQCERSPGDVIAWLISYVDGEEIDRETIGPLDPDAPAVRARCAALLSKPRPRP